MTYNLSAWEVTPSLGRHTPGIHVRIGMISSLNGFLTTSGNSRGLGGEADLAALKTLRKCADAVINTAATVVAENLEPAKTRLHVVLTTSDKLRVSMPLFKEGVERVLIMAGNQVSKALIDQWRAAGARVHQVGDPMVDVRWLIEWLRDEHAVEKVICEGGPKLNAQMSDAGLVDEWCLTLSTQLLANSGKSDENQERLSGPIKHSKTLNLRQLLATTNELVGIYSTHKVTNEIPNIFTV